MTNKTLIILFVDSSPFFGGAARSLLDMAAALPRERFQPILAAASEAVQAAARSAGMEVRAVRFPAPSGSLAPWRALPALSGLLHAREELWKIADSAGARLVHSNSTWAHLAAGDLLSLPCVWHCRDLSRLTGLAGRLADTAAAAVAASHAVAANLTAQGVPAELIRVIPNGVAVRGLPELSDRPSARAKLRAEWGVPENAPLLAWAGEFAPWKRPEDFLSALAELRRTRPDVRGVVLGEALAEAHQGREAEVIGLSEKLGLSGAVKFVGWREDVPQCLAAADVLVLTSENEPFGRVLVEAMAAGVPVVARAGGGVAEVIGTDAGLILDAPGPADYAAAANHLLSDPEETRAQVDAGRRRARELFSPELAAERFAGLYAELAG